MTDIRRSMHLPRSLDVPRARRRLHPLWLLVGVIVLGVAMIRFGKANAAQPERCQIWVQRPGHDWQPLSTRGRPVWTFASCTACSLDMHAALKGEQSGTAMACVDVKTTARR